MLNNAENRKNYIKKIIEQELIEQLSSNDFEWQFFFDKYIINILSDKLSIIDSTNKVIPLKKEPISLNDIRYIEEIKNSIFKDYNIKLKTLKDFEDKIEIWHNKEEDNVSLHDFLGLNFKQYGLLMKYGQIYI